VKRNVLISISITFAIFIGFGIYMTYKPDDSDIREMTISTDQSSFLHLPASIQSISIIDDSPAAIYWSPRNQKAVLSKVIAWLKQAASYTEAIPKSDNIIVHANIGPAQIVLTTSDNQIIKVYPAYYIDNGGKTNIIPINDQNGTDTAVTDSNFQVQYVQNVLAFDTNGKQTYIKSEQIYNWLKTNQWETEFDRI
jgi:hypothetical protein